jgi:hypothetical protein
MARNASRFAARAFWDKTSSLKIFVRISNPVIVFAKNYVRATIVFEENYERGRVVTISTKMNKSDNKGFFFSGKKPKRIA